MVLKTLERALRDIKIAVGDLEPERLATGDAVRLFAVFSALERTIVAGKTLVANRAADSGAWRDLGHRSPASWVAETTGVGLGDAIGLFEAADRLESLPETTEALRRGEISGAQLKAITATAVSNPSTESELLEVAQRSSLKGLKDHCRRMKARSVDEDAARTRYEEIRRNRSLLMWTDADGTGRVEARLTPDDLARFASAIKTKSNAIFAEARKAGHREPTVAYEADALVALVTEINIMDGGRAVAGRRSGRAPTLMHLRVDLAALRRGHLDDGETCEIPGVGPVPLATAVNELGNAILKVIISDGVDVTTVCHLGRSVPAHLRSALEQRDQKCVVPGCDVAQGLEIDHYKIPFERDGPTEMWNLCRICRWHHYLKTHCNYVLTGEPGSWEWRAPSSLGNPVLTS